MANRLYKSASATSKQSLWSFDGCLAGIFLALLDRLPAFLANSVSGRLTLIGAVKSHRAADHSWWLAAKHGVRVLANQADRLIT